MKRYLFILLMVSTTALLNAQGGRERLVENLIENLSDEFGEEQDYTSLVQDLYALYDEPLNLNTATADDFAPFPMLSEVAISNFLNYRDEVGQLYSIYELIAIEGFTQSIVEDIQYFITLKGKTKVEKVRLRDMLRYSKSNVIMRGQRILSLQEGYKNKRLADFNKEADYKKWNERRYLGNPWRYYLRYETRYRDKFKVGLVAEKDHGELFFKGSEKQGFDHYTGFVQINDIGIVETIILGDFMANFGQGLVTWGGYSLGKSGYFVNVNKRSEGVKRYASTNENQFFRGVAATINPIDRLHITAYYSNKKIDANISNNANWDDEQRITSFLNSGYHRSYNEIVKRKTIGERVMGGNVNYTINRLKVGLNYIDYRFTKAFEPTSTLRQLYAFRGSKSSNYSTYANFRYDKIFAFGELAFDRNKAKALLGGVIFNLHEQLSFSMLFRDYDKNYHALYASGFGDRSNTNNEKGYYIGVEMLPYEKWKLNAYFDMYEFPWLQMNTDGLGKGYDYKIKLEYRHSDNLNGYLQLYQEENRKNTSQKSSIRYLVKEQRNKVRIQLDYQVIPSVRFRNRVELSHYQKETEDYNGFIVYHDIAYKSESYPLSLMVRYLLFDIDDYDARIYTYENDVLYSFSTPAFQDRGFRFYLNGRWDITERLAFWAKYSITRYRDKKTIGSGLDMLEGNKRQELKVQLRYKF